MSNGAGDRLATGGSSLAIAHYPRLGCHLAPRILRDFLRVPIPPRFAAGTAAEGLLLSDLDESVWIRFPELAESLGYAVSSKLKGLVQHGAGPHLERRLPALAPDFQIDHLVLGPYTHNAMVGRFGRHPERLSQLPLRELLKVPGLGPHGWADLLTSVETYVDRVEVGRSPLSQQDGLDALEERLLRMFWYIKVASPTDRRVAKTLSKAEGWLRRLTRPLKRYERRATEWRKARKLVEEASRPSKIEEPCKPRGPDPEAHEGGRRRPPRRVKRR